MWLAAIDLHWALLGSERQYCVILRNFRTFVSGNVQSFVLVSPPFHLSSPMLLIPKFSCTCCSLAVKSCLMFQPHPESLLPNEEEEDSESNLEPCPLFSCQLCYCKISARD